MVKITRQDLEDLVKLERRNVPLDYITALKHLRSIEFTELDLNEQVERLCQKLV